MTWWPPSASSTIFRYRGSKTCSGIGIWGKSTTFGRGKSGISGGSLSAGPRPRGGSVLVGARRRPSPPVVNEWPQPQVEVALGFLMANPPPIRSSL